MEEKRCVYCDIELSDSNKSLEHIIPNCIGGQLKSNSICCKSCNSTLGATGDQKFSKIFDPILADIKFLKRDRKKKNYKCSGIASYQNKLYNVTICNGKVSSCPELCKLTRSKLPSKGFTILYKNFNLEDSDFKEGLCKIAFNFAIYNNIPKSSISEGLKIQHEDGVVKDVHYCYDTLPFFPLNIVDKTLESLKHEFLQHTLVLFSSCNQLWCYIELFSTFQFYVRLSSNYNDNEIEHIFSQKIENKAIDNSRQVSNTKNSEDEYASQIAKKFHKLNDLSIYDNSIMKAASVLVDLGFYISDNGDLIPHHFRQKCLFEDPSKHCNYPLLINELAHKRQIDFRTHTMNKFKLLEEYLHSNQD